ncbi:MAG: hypothetical protein ACFFHV_08170 [Promethearchaeota archaeon]
MTENNLDAYCELFEFRNQVEKIVITFHELKRLHENTVISSHNMEVLNQTIKFEE